MDLYGLIGKKLSHSFSPDYFREKFHSLNINAEYSIYELEDADEFPKLLLNNPEIIGLNVTIPYKKSFNQYMDFIDNPVADTGSLNTIKIERINNKVYLKAYNTDVIALEEILIPLLNKNKGIKALILGSGGSASSVAYVLNKLGVYFQTVSRNPSNTFHIRYENIDKEIIESNLLIINTTPLGMYPDIDSFPAIPYEFLTSKHILFDLIYNPSQTHFLTMGMEQDTMCINGLRMLKIQAEASWKIWNS